MLQSSQCYPEDWSLGCSSYLSSRGIDLRESLSLLPFTQVVKIVIESGNENGLRSSLGSSDRIAALFRF